jgi:hypothetical protein
MGLAGVLGDRVGIIPMLTLDCVAYVAGGGMVLLVLLRKPKSSPERREGF